jgi:hypothetical protein
MRRERTEVHVAVGEAIVPGDRSRRDLAQTARQSIIAALDRHRAGPFIGHGWTRDAA